MILQRQNVRHTYFTLLTFTLLFILTTPSISPAAIDKLVYELYGLTEEEIAAVENV